MAEYIVNHALNCASLIPVPEDDIAGPGCTCGAVEHEQRALDLDKARDPEFENQHGLEGLFKLHGVEMTPETYAEANRMRSEALSYQQGEVRSVSATGAEKGTKEARFDLIPTGALTEVAVHFGRGAQKYVPHNWRKGYEFSKGYAALQRHANAWWGGEDLDPEMQTSHLAAVAFHALALLELHGTHPEMDDRYKLTEGANGGQE
ncbi:hypothetical protein SEA_RIOVINA_47 [Arthrobacter phage Riovina]|uniref:dATP/dGTP diphosphohydrolase N-terminal domain-containing protein n=4 Tax=Korravirus hunterdalle TaxID=1982080 RepID=A0A3G8FV58_9CAUD|nr:hypothetical protein SEA_ALEDEL_47 [Arthrobacter phage Aledel]AZS07732.1 hypothetical protein SEA_EUNOIA_47 [Arthrobacter phage Eunoia]AZS09194.1 hypothetical protein SEA_OMALLEY_47 [Arthrobacter phage OMalley]AZS09678.1 hypothetical protein SEA_RIOVINA_47 [Arthrobacter phage Riovina]